MNLMKNKLSLILLLGGFLIGQLQATAEVLKKDDIIVDKNTPVISKDVKIGKKVTQINNLKTTTVKAIKTKEVATGLVGSQLNQTSQKYAIIIGISDYPETSYDLNYSDDDAIDVENALKNYYGFSSENIIKLIDTEESENTNKILMATRANILNAIDAIITKAKPEDEVVFYYSGHGGYGNSNDGDKESIDECIMVHDGKALVPIWDGELKAKFNNLLTSRVVFIFDSCYSGGMDDLSEKERIVVTASTENTLSYEVSSLNNSEFTYYMIENGIINEFAKKYLYNNVSIEEAFDYMRINSTYNLPTINDNFKNDLCL